MTDVLGSISVSLFILFLIYSSYKEGVKSGCRIAKIDQIIFLKRQLGDSYSRYYNEMSEKEKALDLMSEREFKIYWSGVQHSVEALGAQSENEQ